MKIAVVAANGKAGRLIVEEAADRGMGVTCIRRNQVAAFAAVSGHGAERVAGSFDV